MKKTFKILGIVLSIPVVLFVIAAIVLASLDLNNYRSNIEQLVMENTGRQLSVQGDLKKSFFPWLGVSIGSVALSNAKGFKPEHFASVDAVDVKIDTVSLLTLKPKISRIIVKGLNLNLAKNKKGETNWSDLTKSGTTETSQEPSSASSVDDKKIPQQTEGADLDALAMVNVEGISIVEANVNWVDDQAGASYSVKHVNLSVSEIAVNKPIALDLDFELTSKEPEISAKIKLSSKQLDWDLSNQRYGLKPLILNVHASGKGLPVSPLNTVVQIMAAADLNKQTLDISELSVETLGLTVRAEASVTQLLDAPRYQSTIELARMNPRHLLEQLSVALPPMADKTVLGAFSLMTNLKGDTQNVQVSDLKMQIDDTKLVANASVKNFAKTAITASLSLDKMNLDRYLPPVPEDKASTPQAANESSAEATSQPLPIPVDLLRSLDVDVNVKAEKLTIQKLDLDNVIVKARISKGVATLSPVSLAVSGGSMQSDITLDVKTDTPRYSVKHSIKRVQAAPVVKAVAGEAYLSGILSLQAAVVSEGDTVENIKKNLNGSLSFSFENGAVKDVNLGEMARKAKAKLDKKEYVESNEPRQTDFAQLNGTADIKNGVISNNDLSAKSPLVRVEGKGKVNLVAENLDYLVTTYVVDSSKGQGGKSAEELKGIPIPIQLTGPFSNIQWDYKWTIIRDAMTASLKKAAKKELETKKQEVKQEAKQKLEEKKEEKKEEVKEKAKEKLKKLFKF